MAAARTLCVCVALFYSSKENAVFNRPDCVGGRESALEQNPPGRVRKVIQSREVISKTIKCYVEVEVDGTCQQSHRKSRGTDRRKHISYPTYSKMLYRNEARSTYEKSK